MKIRVMVLSCLIGAVVLFAPVSRDGYSRAESKTERVNTKIGIVNIRKIFGDCKRNVRYREQAAAEQNSIVAELEKLSKEIEAERAGLKTLKTGSSDYLASMKEILEQQAKLQAQQEFHKQQIELKDRQWTEGLYKDILRETGEVAKQKGLDLVFEKDNIEFPSPSANELMLSIRTHKLLYSGGCLDITSEVLARLDAQEGRKRKTKNTRR